MINLLTESDLEHAGWWCVPWVLADSRIRVLNSAGLLAVLLLHMCDNSKQSFFLKAPKLTPYNICRAGLWPVSFSHLYSKADWVGRRLRHCLALLNLFLALKLFRQVDGFLLCFHRKCPTIKKMFLWDEAMLVFVSHPHRHDSGSQAQREQLFVPLPVDLVLPAVLFLECCTVCVCCLPASQPSMLIAFCSLACMDKAVHIKCNRKSSIKFLQNPFASKLRFGEKSMHFPEARGISSRWSCFAVSPLAPFCICSLLFNPAMCAV